MVAENGNPKLRALGADVRGEIVESPSSMLLEANDVDNYLCQLERMEDTFKEVQADLKKVQVDLKKVKADLEEERITNAVIVDEGFSIRAFLNYVVNRFCELAGKGHLDPYHQWTMLFTYEATKFVKKGGSFSFFYTSITVNTTLLSVV